MNFSSKLIEDAVNQFSRLPGIGKKTALRLVLHLLKMNPEEVKIFGEAMINMRRDIRFCEKCHNVADDSLCRICSNHARNKRQICIVENIRDVMAIEGTQQYSGLYHVLGGVISPLDGIGPDKLEIESLLKRIETYETDEVIFALSPTLEGDTTTFFISKKLETKPIRITTISRGVAFGGELEYTDELTLARSIQSRLPLSQLGVQ